MRWMVSIMLVGLVGCGMSAEEKTNIAFATCNILSEYSESDGVARIKEVNSAREKLKQPLFIGSGEDIQDSLEYGLCADLIFNDLEYNVLLAEAKQSRVGKFQQFLGGAWFYTYESESDESGEYGFVVAEFLDENVIISNYATYDGYKQVKRELMFRTQILDESRIIASGSSKSDFIINVDWNEGTIGLSAFALGRSEEEGLNFRKAPQISIADIHGNWLTDQDFDDGSFYLTQFSEDALRHYSRIVFPDDKTFEDDTESCRLSLESGFILVEFCEDNSPHFFPVTNYSRSKMEIFVYGESYHETRVRSDYELPQPPTGYRDVATIN